MSQMKGRCGNCGGIPGQDQPRLYRGLCGSCRRDAKAARCGDCGDIPGQDQPRLYRGLCGSCRRDAKDAAAAAEAQARAEARRQSVSGRSNLVARFPDGFDVGAYTYAQLDALAPAGMTYCSGCRRFRSRAGQHGEARRWRGHRCPDCVSDNNAGYYADNRGRLLANLNAKREPERNAKAERRVTGGNTSRQSERREERSIEQRGRNRAERDALQAGRLQRARPAVRRAVRGIRTSSANAKNAARIDQGGAGRRPRRSSRRNRR